MILWCYKITKRCPGIGSHNGAATGGFSNSAPGVAVGNEGVLVAPGEAMREMWGTPQRVGL